MIENNYNYGICPTLSKEVEPTLSKEVEPTLSKEVEPTLSKEVEVFRITTCSKILEKIKKNIENDMEKRKKKKKTHSRLQFLNYLSSSGSIALSTSGVGVSGSGVGIVVGGPLVAIGGILGVISLITLRLDKGVMKKLLKHEKLISLGKSKLYSINNMVNKALSDGKISEKEYEIISAEDYKYEIQKAEILKTLKQKTEITKSKELLATQFTDLLN